jgi:hypothetical protein
MNYRTPEQHLGTLACHVDVTSESLTFSLTQTYLPRTHKNTKSWTQYHAHRLVTATAACVGR